jgi:hypothetical protein
VLGSLTIITLAWWHRHANNVNPINDKLKSAMSAGAMDGTAKVPAAPAAEAKTASAPAASEDFSFGF